MSLRILLTHHFPLDWPVSGPNVQQLASQLRSRGHVVRILVVDRGLPDDDHAAVRHIVCNPAWEAADLKFPLPTFDADAGLPDTISFAALDDSELVSYRDVLREVLDDEVASFNPHIVHAQHVWIYGHLALEAGVPYVLTAWGPELRLQAADARYRRYASEAAENAGRILAADESVQDLLHQNFGELDHRVVLLGEYQSRPMEQLYEEVLQARFGDGFRP